MNYRHAYHAGNFADVFKHAILALVVEALKRKHTAFCGVDTHAGVGRYDLAAPEAVKTGEADGGVRKLAGRQLPPELGPYWRCVKAVNPVGVDRAGVRWYPGSPRVLRHLMRPQDRLLLAELHPEDARALAAEFDGDPQVHVRVMDAYTALKARLPPQERRGLVLIDPPFEVTDEFTQLQRGLTDAWRRWPTGVYLVWYPIKSTEPVAAFHAWLRAHTPAETMAAHLLVHPLDDDERLNGCGLAIVNPPWKLDEQLETLLPFLLSVLDQGGGCTELTWLVSEETRHGRA